MPKILTSSNYLLEFNGKKTKNNLILIKKKYSITESITKTITEKQTDYLLTATKTVMSL